MMLERMLREARRKMHTRGWTRPVCMWKFEFRSPSFLDKRGFRYVINVRVERFLRNSASCCAVLHWNGRAIGLVKFPVMM